jgi:MFS family permease
MIEASKYNFNKNSGFRGGFLFAAFLLIFGALLTAFLLLFVDDDVWKTSMTLYLLPWIAATAIVLLAPTAYLLYYKKFDVFHPLVHASWSYWFPAFVIGGMVVASGYIYPYQMTLIADPEEDFKWTYIYIMLGYIGMTAGFSLPFAKRWGTFLNRKLPTWDWQPKQVILPAIIFLSIGLFFYVSAFLSGVVGFSTVDLADSFATLNYMLSLLALQAGFLVAIYVFKAKTITPQHIIAFGVIGIVLVSRLSLGGNRGSLLLIVYLLAMAFVYSGRKLKFIHGVVFVTVAILAILGGMIYGTTFRNLKGAEERTGVDKQLEYVGQTIDQIATRDTGKILDEAFYNLGERIDGVSSVAVVVSNYERLKPYEASHGLENNIFTELWTMFIPRFLWANKPLIYDARSYSDLYFNFSGNSYAMTPVADLLRNFGPLGVPLGMFVIGLFLRIVYAALIEDQAVTIGRATAYYMFIASVSYEGYYTAVILYGWRVLLIVLVTFLFADYFLISKKRL